MYMYDTESEVTALGWKAGREGGKDGVLQVFVGFRVCVS